jgi:D-amino peptidase
MKAFISVDLEGMPHVVIPGHLNLKGPLYDEARKIATRVTLTVADELNKNGFEEVVVADSHGPMVNVLVDDLPEYMRIIRGFPRPLSMVSGVESCDVALFVGYHAKFGTAKSSFDHTYSGGSINKLEINGVAVSEFLLNSYAAGELNVPVILVAGEAQLLLDDVRKYSPWAEIVPLKHSLGRVSAESPSMLMIEKNLRKSVKKAVSKFRKGLAKPLKTRKPVKVKVTFLMSQFADTAELLPSVTRVDGLAVEYNARDVLEAYKTFELLVLAASGVSSILSELR